MHTSCEPALLRSSRGDSRGATMTGHSHLQSNMLGEGVSDGVSGGGSPDVFRQAGETSEVVRGGMWHQAAASEDAEEAADAKKAAEEITASTQIRRDSRHRSLNRGNSCSRDSDTINRGSRGSTSRRGSGENQRLNRVSSRNRSGRCNNSTIGSSMHDSQQRYQLQKM